MKLGIRTKLIALYCLVFAVLFSVLAVVVYRSVNHNDLARLDARLQQYAFGIEHELASQIGETDFPDTLDLNSVRPVGLSDARYLLYDSRRQIIIGDPSLKISLPVGNVQTPIFGYWKTGHSTYRTLWIELEPQPEETYLLLLTSPMEDLQEGLEHLGWLLLLLLPAGLLLAGVTSWFIISRAFRPLANMIHTADRISASNLAERLPLPDARDEIRELGTVFNNMIDRLHAAFNTQRQFIGDASHELRTPLAVIRTELEFAERSVINSDQMQSLKIAMEELDHLAALTTNLLTLARLDSGAEDKSSQVFDLNDLATDCVERLLPLAERKSIALDLQLTDPLMAQGDWDRLETALTNLLENAVKYSPSGSTVTVRVERDGGCPLPIQIIVEDQGPGIEADALPHIFERFYRAINSRQPADGSGLGLAIAREIAHRHGGEILAENMVDSGARFSIALPDTMNSSTQAPK